MLRTLQMSFALKNTYRVNTILYSLKQIPLLKRILPDTLYQVRGLKIFAIVLAVVWEVISIFLFKCLYFLIVVGGLEMFRPDLQSKEVFLHILLFLTLIGSYMNTSLFDATWDKYYAVILLRMNARSYTLVNYGYSLLKVVIGFTPYTLLLGWSQGVPLWLCLLIPFAVAGSKVAADSYSLWVYKKTGYIRNDSNLKKWHWLLTTGLLSVAYLPPLAGAALPFPFSAALWVLCIPAGLLGLWQMTSFRYFREITQELLAGLFIQIDAAKKAVKTATQKSISTDLSITSHKKGIEYLNELFIRRHRKILWHSAVRSSIICAALCLCLLLFMFFTPESKPALNEMVLTWLPFCSFIMYLINCGTSFTNALFNNCDHSLLTYPFYKQPKFIVRLFQIRLRELMKINLAPAMVISLGLAVILYVSGGTENPLNYAVLIVSVLAMSVFFSIHYLTIYYLLQPYTAGSDMKSGTYRVLLILTYVVCYAMMQLRLPLFEFGAACIIFCVLYSIVSSILVYRYAPQTFRLRT